MTHVTTGITKNVKTFPVTCLANLRDQWNGTPQTVNKYTFIASYPAPKNFEAFLKRVGLAYFFFGGGGGAEPQGGMVFSRGGPGDFQLESLNQ